MKRVSLLLLVFAAFWQSCSSPVPEIQEVITSPNGTVVVTVFNSDEGQLSYSVRFQNKPVIEASALGFEFENQAPLGQKCDLFQPIDRVPAPSGKQSGERTTLSTINTTSLISSWKKTVEKTLFLTSFQSIRRWVGFSLWFCSTIGHRRDADHQRAHRIQNDRRSYRLVDSCRL